MTTHHWLFERGGVVVAVLAVQLPSSSSIVLLSCSRSIKEGNWDGWSDAKCIRCSNSSGLTQCVIL
jgi:hypothetical protein